MQLIVNPGETLTAVMSGAATTSNPKIIVRYGDHQQVMGGFALSGVTAVTIAGATNGRYHVHGLSICNTDTAAVTITLAVTILGVSYTFDTFTLQVGDTYRFDEDSGSQVTDSSGKIKVTSSSTAIQPFTIAATDWRKTDGVTINPVTAATTNFGVVYGTDGTDFPHLETIDGKNATTIVVSRCCFKLPENYIAGSAITIRVRAGMKTTVATNSGATTMGLNVYSNSGVANLGSADLNTTAAQTINSLTAADKDFVITPTGLVAGQDLHIKLSLTVTDVATGTAVIGTVNHVELRTSVLQ